MNRYTGSNPPSDWNSDNTEVVNQCPCCNSILSTIAHENVSDWSFYSDYGSWIYLQCEACSTLYLNPRPKESAIGKVYSAYYTHNIAARSDNFKHKLMNECFAHWFGINVLPQLELGRVLRCLLKPLRPFVYVPFPIAHIYKQHPGSLIDVGCGNGDLIYNAKKMGWTVSGIEIDETAANAARCRNLTVFLGSYEVLAHINQTYDCVVCSHVIEHVYNPKLLISLLLCVTKPGGTIYLALPNPQSFMRGIFGKYWRGLEAPRHITLPSVAALTKILKDEGVDDITVFPTPIYTFAESVRLRYGKINGVVRFINKIINSASTLFPLSHRQDMIEICVHKRL